MFGSTTTSSGHSSGNPFAPKPFGVATNFGSPFEMPNSSGNTSVVVGATFSPFPSPKTVDATSTPTFGGSTTGLGFASAPALGFSSSGSGASGNSSGNPFAPKPFDLATNFGSPFGMLNSSGNTSVMVGATFSPFPSPNTVDASSTPTFGGSITGLGFASAPALGFSSSGSGASGNSSGNLFAPKPFGVATNFASPFGMPNSIGTTSGVVGATFSPFPSTKTIDASSTPTFGGSTTGLGFTSAPALGFSSSGFGGSSAFGQTLVIGASNTTGIGLSSNPTFGQSTMVFGGSNSLGTTKSWFGTNSSFSGSQITTPTFGGQNRGSRVATYTRTRVVELDPTAKQPEKLVSISAMPVYKDKSHEELRSEDYQFVDKGGFVSQNFDTKPTASMTPYNTSTSNILDSPKPDFCVSSRPFSSSSFSNFLTNLSASTSVMQPIPVSGPNSLSQSSHPFTGSFNSPTSMFTTPSSASVLSSFSLSSFTNSLTSPCTLSTSVTLPASPFAPTSWSSLLQPSSSPDLSVNPVSTATSVIPFPSNTPLFANSPSTISLFTPSTTVTVPEPSLFVSSPSISTLVSPSRISPVLSFTNNQPSLLLRPAHSPQNNNGSVTVTEAGGQNNIAQGFDYLTTAAGQPSSGVNPFGSLPPIPKMSIDGPRSSATVRYGISSLPVQNKPAPVRVSSLLTIRHLSRRNRLPVQKYDPKVNGPKVPFFSDDREIPDSQFVPRENPRALVIQPTEHWPLRANSGKLSVLGEKLSSTHLFDNSENGTGNVDIHSDKLNLEQTDDSAKERDSPVKVPEVQALLPKLQLSGYYTEPRIQELAAKERADPGFCSHVKNFVVGRHGYGSIKFIGKTDVRRLDLESYVEFNNREVIVYKDESKKPPVGQGLNKPAEVTLLNIKCFDKKTGNQCIDGPKLDLYQEMLMKKAAEQGAAFVSYDPVGGEWKFRVQHF